MEVMCSNIQINRIGDNYESMVHNGKAVLILKLLVQTPLVPVLLFGYNCEIWK